VELGQHCDEISVRDKVLKAMRSQAWDLVELYKNMDRVNGTETSTEDLVDSWDDSF
jgi:hypothetical protein